MTINDAQRIAQKFGFRIVVSKTAGLGKLIVKYETPRGTYHLDLTKSADEIESEFSQTKTMESVL